MSNKFAIREAAIVSFYDIDLTGDEKLSVRLDSLKMTDIAHTANTVYARGGRGNPRIVGFSGDKEVAVTIQDALFTTHSLAMLNGTEITSTAKTIRRVDIKQISATNTVTLDKKLVKLVSIRVLDNFNFPISEVDKTAVTMVGNVLTLPAGNENKFVEVAYDTAIPLGKNKTITVDATMFGGVKKMVVDVLVRDAFTGNDYTGQLIAPRVKIEEDYTFNFSPEGDPSVLDIPVQILKAPNGSAMYELIIFDADDLEI